MRTLVAAALILAACPGPRHPSAPSGPDAPYDLADEGDFTLLRDRLWAMSPGPDRDAARRGLTGVLIEAAQAHLAAGKQELAHADLLEAADLFERDPDAIGAALAPHTGALARMHARFAESGADAETATTLVLLADADPAHADGDRTELDEVLAFADDLAASEHGPDGRGGAPIAVIAPIARALPARWLVDRYVQMLLDRQARISYLLDHQQATFDLVQAHRDVAVTARAIATVLARAGRAPEIAARIAGVHGIGEDATLLARARRVAAGGAASDWIALAVDLRDAKAGGDPEASLAVCLAARARLGDDATLDAAAGTAASQLGRVEQAIALFEAARSRAPADAELVRRLAPLYRERMARLAESGRPSAAAAELARAEEFFDRLGDRAADPVIKAERARTRIAAGRGLLGQGDVEQARALLTSAVELAPDADGFEALATIAIARGRWTEARSWTAIGLQLPEREPGAQFAHAKLLRLDGDAYAGAGDARHARNDWLEALREWADLGDKVELPPDLAGLRMVESAKVLWDLGEHERGFDLLDAAMDLDEDGSNTYIAVVEYLLDQGQLDHAADAVHRALGADGVAAYNKVYLCLYVVAEAAGAGRAPDPLALGYLAHRDGRLWTDDLARLATGRADVAALAPRATTRARKAELAYYGAMLGGLDDARKKELFDRVIASDLITFFEYDMARRHERRAMASSR